MVARFDQTFGALSDALKLFASLLHLLGVARLLGFLESLETLREATGFATYSAHLLGVPFHRAFDVAVGLALFDEVRFELAEDFGNLLVVFDAGRLAVQFPGAFQAIVHQREQLIAARDAFERLAARTSQPEPQPER